MFMRQFFFIWAFYKPFAVTSFIITALIGFINPNIGVTLIIKAFLVVFLWYLVNETRAKRKLIFYKNFGFNSFKLFSSLFLIDSIISITYLLVFKNFA